MPRVLFRSRFNRILSIVAWVALAALAGGTLLTPGAFTAAPGLVLGAAAVAALVWAVLWAPHIAVDDSAATVANVLLEHTVPWEALIHVDTRYALVLHTPHKRVSVTAAPAPGALGAVRATRAHRRSDDARTSSVRPGDLPGTDSGNAAEIVKARWERLRDTGRIEAGRAETTPVVTRPRTLSIATIVLAATALVCAVLLV